MRKDAGFTYLALLFFVALMGIVLATTGMLWSTAQQREKERDLLFIGNEYRKAIASYYERTPGTVKRYPDNFNDLLKDNRQLTTTRHLRRLYIDPMTSTPQWGAVRAPEGGIRGVYSLSTDAPLKRNGFTQKDETLNGAKNYTEWRFTYEPPIVATSDSNKTQK
ncbi:MAG: type II secretion system protein [Pseudomonadota bacterium]